MAQKLKFISAILFSLLFLSQKSFCQSNEPAAVKKDSVPVQKKDSAKIMLSGYVDGYYAYFTDSLPGNNYQKFSSVSPRSNSIGLNIAVLQAKYASEKVRGVVALHFGDIPRSIWATSGYLFAIQEANAGIRLSKKVWLDGGFFRKHIGAEGLLPKENICSSVAVTTYMEPHYEAGFKLNYNPSDKFALNLFVLNGYNIYEDNNNQKSFGMLATYAVNDNFNIGYSNYMGDDSPNSDTIAPVRFFNNFFLNYQTHKIKMQIGGDYVFQKTDDPNDPALVMSCLGSLRYQLTKKTGIYIRGEYFSDAQGFLSGTYTDMNGQATGLTISGVTAGIEYKPTDNAYLRLEGRQLNAEKVNLFYWKGNVTDVRNEMMVHLGVSF